MSTPNSPPSSRFGRKSRTQIKQATFLDRHYRAVHHVGLALGLCIFFGPFAYRYFTRPPVDQIVHQPRNPRLDYQKLQAELDARWK